MSLLKHIDKVRDGLKRGKYSSEAIVAQGIVLPALHELEWPIFDTGIVIPEFTVETRRVDFALCHPINRPAVFIEVKKVGLSDGADKQLFEYAFHLGVPLAILTDGQEWSFYLPGEQGRYDERRVYKLDLLERDIEEIAKRLERYLNYQKVISGEALKAARSDYQNVARDREIEKTLPRAWKALVEEPDSLLLELLAEKVEDLCGYKPDLELCNQFLENNPSPIQKLGSSNTPTHESKSKKDLRTRTVEDFVFTFQGKTYKAGSARDVMTKFFHLLVAEDPDFLEKFASRKHGKKRRYVAKDLHELYPGRADLAEDHSVEIIPGWWLGTNYSRSSIQKIIDLALEVIPAKLRSTIKINVK